MPKVFTASKRSRMPKRIAFFEVYVLKSEWSHTNALGLTKVLDSYLHDEFEVMGVREQARDFVFTVMVMGEGTSRQMARRCHEQSMHLPADLATKISTPVVYAPEG